MIVIHEDNVDAMLAHIDEGVGDIAAQIRDYYAGQAPVDTGLMVGSVYRGQIAQFHWVVKAPAPYSEYVERGTHNDDGSVKMAARPVMAMATYQQRTPRNLA